MGIFKYHFLISYTYYIAAYGLLLAKCVGRSMYKTYIIVTRQVARLSRVWMGYKLTDIYWAW
jgi:hypothetical protein